VSEANLTVLFGNLRCRESLQSVFDLVTVVDVLDSQDAANLELLSRPELGVTFTKLHCWRLTQYSKCVFLDADTLVRIDIFGYVIIEIKF